MRITVLSDNLPARGLEAEWGLSLYLAYQGHALLLDTGASDLFARNAEALGLDLGLWPSASSPTPTGTTPTGWTPSSPGTPPPPSTSRQAAGRSASTTPLACGGMRGQSGGCWTGLPPGFGTSPGPSLLCLGCICSPTTPGLARRGRPLGCSASGRDSGCRTTSPTSRPWCWRRPGAGPPEQLLPRRGGHHHPGGPSRFPRLHPSRPSSGFHLTRPRPGGPGPGPPPSGHRGGPGPHRPLHRGARVCPAREELGAEVAQFSTGLVVEL